MSRKTVYNNITSEELYNQVSKENKQLVSDCLEWCRAEDKSMETLRVYTSDLRIFFVWNLKNNNNKFFADVDKKDIMKYQNYLMGTLGHSPARIRSLKSALSTLSNYIEVMEDDQYPKFRNIINKIKPPANIKIREKTVLSEDQIKLVLDTLVAEDKLDMACCFALAAASGARKSELLRFKVSHFTKENIIFGSLYKTPEKIKTKGRGKLGKPLNKYVIVNEFQQYFDLWIEKRNKFYTGEEIFVNLETKKPVQISTLNSWAKYITKILNTSFYFHSLRHFFCSKLKQNDIPDELIKEIIGWENLEMISVYNDNNVSDDFVKYFNESGIIKKEKKDLSDL